MSHGTEDTHEAIAQACKALFTDGHTPTNVIAGLLYEAAVLYNLQAQAGESYEFAEIARCAPEAVRSDEP